MNTVVQLEVEGPLVVSVQGLGSTVAVEPVGCEVIMTSTVPCGGLFVPGAVSVTVTVQVVGLLAGVETGQLRTVDVARAVTPIVALPLLPPWTESGAGT